MKRILYLLLLVLTISIEACYDDTSTYDTGVLPEIKINLDNIEENLHVAYLGNLKIDIPVSKDGQVDHPDLAYLWELESSGLENIKEVVSRERILDVTVTVPISAAGYDLLLTVTDSATSLQYFAKFKVVVESEFGEGLLVAHSSNGQTSDLSLIMDEHLTKNFTGERKVFHHIYASQGKEFPDKMLNMLYTISGATWGSYENIIWGVGEKDVYRINLKDFSYVTTKSIVPLADASFKGNAFYPAPQATLLVANTSVYQHGRQNDKMFVKPERITNSSGMESNSVDNGIVATVTGDFTGHRAEGVWYDSHGGCFGRYNSMFSVPKCQLYSSSEYRTTFPFDPSNIVGKKAIAGGRMEEDGLAILLKDQSTGGYEIYIFKTKNPDYNIVAPTPYALYYVPMELKEILDNAVSFTFSTVDPIMYVATKTEVYAVRMSLGSLQYESKYMVIPGEEISIVQFYQQGRARMDASSFDKEIDELPLNEKAILLVTHEEGDGKIRLIPQKDLGTGNLDKDKEVLYDGFGEISCIVVQGK